MLEDHRIPTLVISPVLEVHLPLPHHRLVQALQYQHAITRMMHVNSLKTASVVPIVRRRLEDTAQNTPTALTVIHAKHTDLTAAIHVLLLDVIGVPRMHCV